MIMMMTMMMMMVSRGNNNCNHYRQIPNPHIITNSGYIEENLREVCTLKATRQAVYIQRDIEALCVTFVAVEKQLVLNIMCVCVCVSEFYPA